jgi:hypothetical protein
MATLPKSFGTLENRSQSLKQRHNKALHSTAYSLRYASFLGSAPASGGG